MSTGQNPSPSPCCPDCGSRDVLHVGRIPATNVFAGQLLAQPLDGGHLWHCGACFVRFRWPTFGKVQFDALYTAGAEYAWESSSSKRRDWQIARQWLCPVLPKGSSVLDVGCFDGGFLDFLGDAYGRYGIEINPAARWRAEAKGITVIGTDFEAILHTPEPMDCVTAFDVIEHVQQPARFLDRCRDLVKPGGWIVISTGNADSLSFRFMRAGYWYCTVGEHLSFISPKWCRKIAEKLGLIIGKQAIFSHGRRDVLHYPPEVIKNALYRMAPWFFVWLRQHGFGKKDATTHLQLAAHPPGWMTAKDHFITVFQRR